MKNYSTVSVVLVAAFSLILLGCGFVALRVTLNKDKAHLAPKQTQTQDPVPSTPLTSLPFIAPYKAGLGDSWMLLHEEKTGFRLWVLRYDKAEYLVSVNANNQVTIVKHK